MFNNTICTETGEYITHKIDRIIADCEKHNIDLVANQEHRLKTTEIFGYSQHKQHNNWTLAPSDSSTISHGVAILYNKNISELITSITVKSEHIKQ